MKRLSGLMASGALAMVLMLGAGAGAALAAEPAALDDAADEAAATEMADIDALETDEVAPEADEEENYDTGDASLDDPLNQDEIGEHEILVVSFGTSYNDNRRLTIGAIESALTDEFSDDWSVRRAFTSQIIIDHVASRDGEIIDNMEEALERAIANGVTTLVVQPTHLMNGYEYDELVEAVAQYADAFDVIEIGDPLLTTDEDFRIVMEAVVDATADYDDGTTAIVLMGHGTGADSNGIYAAMQDLLTEAGYDNYFVGTVEATPSVEDVLELVEAADYERVVLRPLMIVAGDHANNDMAGDDEDSWKSIFEDAGYDVVTVIEGLGQLEAVQDLIVEHTQAAVERALAAEADVTETKDAPAEPADSAAEAAEAADADEAEAVMAGPIYAESLNDGTYAIDVDSSSSMFNIVACELTVADGEMTAVMTMSGTGYECLYMGTGEEAAEAPESDYIPYTENADGSNSFTVPVEALDTDIDCAAFSKNRQEWYDRTLVFRADSLPEDAFAEGTFATVESLELADGTYTVEVALEGGSGRASVESPAELVIEDGQATVTLIWSSSNYDYMVVDGQQYLPTTVEGGSTFEIPIAIFDRALDIAADTTAMSSPHEIEYTLYVDSTTIEEA